MSFSISARFVKAGLKVRLSMKSINKWEFEMGDYPIDAPIDEQVDWLIWSDVIGRNPTSYLCQEWNIPAEWKSDFKNKKRRDSKRYLAITKAVSGLICLNQKDGHTKLKKGRLPAPNRESISYTVRLAKSKVSISQYWSDGDHFFVDVARYPMVAPKYDKIGWVIWELVFNEAEIQDLRKGQFVNISDLERAYLKHRPDLIEQFNSIRWHPRNIRLIEEYVRAIDEALEKRRASSLV